MGTAGICIGTVVYSSVLGFIDDFIGSITAQTTDNFDLLMIEDDLTEKEQEFLRRKTDGMADRTSRIRGKRLSTPVQLRFQLIKAAKEKGYQILILGDSDDRFAKDRVECTWKTFDMHPEATFVYNELRYFDGTACMPELPRQVTEIGQILDHNFLGLSNTAIRLTDIKTEELLSFEDFRSFVLDWYLYSRLLMNGHQGVRAEETCTYYRIHEDNFAGTPERTEASMTKEIAVKTEHYGMLAKHDAFFEEYYEAYRDRRIRVTERRMKPAFWWDYTRKG